MLAIVSGTLCMTMLSLGGPRKVSKGAEKLIPFQETARRDRHRHHRAREARLGLSWAVLGLIWARLGASLGLF